MLPFVTFGLHLNKFIQLTVLYSQCFFQSFRFGLADYCFQSFSFLYALPCYSNDPLFMLPSFSDRCLFAGLIVCFLNGFPLFLYLIRSVCFFFQCFKYVMYINCEGSTACFIFQQVYIKSFLDCLLTEACSSELQLDCCLQ